MSLTKQSQSKISPICTKSKNKLQNNSDVKFKICCSPKQRDQHKHIAYLNTLQACEDFSLSIRFETFL